MSLHLASNNEVSKYGCLLSPFLSGAWCLAFVGELEDPEPKVVCSHAGGCRTLNQKARTVSRVYSVFNNHSLSQSHGRR